MSEQVNPAPVVAVNKTPFGAWLATWLTIIVTLITIVFFVLPSFGVHIVIGSLEQPAPTVRALLAVQPDPAAPRPAQAVPTAIPAAPTPLPQGAPAVQAEQPAAAPVEGAPAPVVGPNPDAPAVIKTRAPVCFGGWWYVEGQNTSVSCSGTGGD